MSTIPFVVAIATILFFLIVHFRYKILPHQVSTYISLSPQPPSHSMDCASVTSDTTDSEIVRLQYRALPHDGILLILTITDSLLPMPWIARASLLSPPTPWILRLHPLLWNPRSSLISLQSLHVAALILHHCRIFGHYIIYPGEHSLNKELSSLAH